MTNVIFALLTIVFLTTAAADDASILAAPPDWYVESVQFMTMSGGVWVTDNAEYKGDDEPWDSYAMEWRAGPGGNSMAGRMWGIKDGEASVMDFWHFSQYWDPALRVAVLQQSGFRSTGNGTIVAGKAKGETELNQTFTDFNGTSEVHGHRSSNPSESSHVTTSYDIDEEGNWTEMRSYTWHRQMSE